MNLSNWGNYPRIDTNLVSCRSQAGLERELALTTTSIPRGLGRCYGDSALNDQTVLSCLRMDHMLSFDESSGLLVAEAGVSLSDILDIFLPRGWFLPVTPGTKFVTLGGAVASDVHGKNHHVAGSFCDHVSWMDMLTASGEVVRCSRDRNEDLFLATCGGMGLTGVILRVALALTRVQSAFIRQETVKTANLTEIMDCFEASTDWTYSVAWIDCLATGEAMGRSIMMRGEHATYGDLSGKRARRPLYLANKSLPAVPFNFPGFALNSLSVRAFNNLYYAKAKSGLHTSIVDANTFFYPLDAVPHWNRIYGSRGFTQYQFVLPLESSRQGLPTILKAISASGLGSFLAVLKLFGRQDGLLSFPMEGYTLALDFPITEKLFRLLPELDAMVNDFGGRLYLTKDARMDQAMFEKGYGHVLEEFRSIKRKWDPDNRFKSLQSQRIGV